MRATILEIDTKKFNNNIDNIQKYVGNKVIMPVLKANAYGTYINKRIDILKRFDIIGVAIIDEAIEIRNLGYKNDIFLLNQPYKDDLEEIVKYNVTFGLSDIAFIDEIRKIKNKVKVHLEIETGMNRTGIKIEDLEYCISKLKKNSDIIIVEGVYTHLSSADIDNEYTMEQLKKFGLAVKLLKENFNTIKYIHSSASNGLLKYDDKISNTVRPGIIIYGYESYAGCSEIVKIQPIAKLKTKIVFLKDVKKGESIGYSRKYIAQKDCKIATICIGYDDGLRRNLSNNGKVVVNNERVSIVGNVCMDSCMIDVTNVPNVKVGTDVYIWDNNLITVDDIANECSTINYEILCTISDRVRREFK